MMKSLYQRVKRMLRGPGREMQARYTRWRHGFGEQEFRSALARLGVRAGDAVLVHSSMAAFAGFHGTAMDVIRILESTVTAEGTLLMPTFTWLRNLDQFMATGKIFDPRTTPSQVGLISDLFRRSAGVRRSVHPTHSIAAWGADAEWWVADHHLADTPCGRGSAFFRLLERNGKILLAGVDVSKLSFYHCAEELLEPALPESPFSPGRYILRCRVNGQMVETGPMRFYDPVLSSRRILEPLEAELRRLGRWHEIRAGTLILTCLAAAEVLDTLQEMANRGQFCYAPPTSITNA